MYATIEVNVPKKLTKKAKRIAGRIAARSL